MNALESGRGFVKVRKSDDAGETVAINFNSSGDQFDEIVLLRNRPRDTFYYFHDLWRLHPRMCGAFVTIILICLPISIAFGVLMSQDPETIYKWVSYPSWVEENAAYSYKGMVATDDARCSELGAEVLEGLGGNAVDAAVAAALCLGVLSPGSSGLGGGSFLLFYNATSRSSVFVDGRETAPQAAHTNMYVKDPLLSYGGGLAVAVPGQIHALHRAWELHGKANWYDIVMPAAKMARRFQVSSTLAGHIKKVERELLTDRRYSRLRSYLNGRYNRLARAGEYLENIALSDTLTYIAARGPSHFYTGHDAIDLANEITEAGGVITTEDLEAYTALVRDPIVSETMGHMYYGAPPPSSGGLTLSSILMYLDGFSIPLVSQGGVYFHHLVEAFKHAFALRMSLGDPGFVNVTDISEAMLDPEYIASLREGDSDYSVHGNLEDYGGEEAAGNKHGRRMVEDHGTSHLSVVDKWGNSVSLTSTVNTYFGSKIFSRSTGMVLNNQMDDFSSPNTTNYFNLAPFETNYIEPGKRPLSSMSPFVLADRQSGATRLVGGASGGPVIITSSVQIILNVIARGMSLLDAFVEPRIHSQLYPDEVTYEHITGLDAWGKNGITNTAVSGGDGGNTDDDEEIKNTKGYSISVPTSTLDALTKRGHTVREDGILGVTQFISVDPDTGEMLGVSDPRKNGKAYGVSDVTDDEEFRDEGEGVVLTKGLRASQEGA